MARELVDVMLARSVDCLPTGAGWAFEPKLDGFRCYLKTAGGKVVMRSRRQRPLERYFPDVVAAAKRLPHGVVLDGELVIPRQDGGVDFAALQRRLHPTEKRAAALARQTPAALVAFDLLALAGRDLRDQPYDQRRAALIGLLGHPLDRLGIMPMTTDAEAARSWLLDQPPGIEGVVAKRRGSLYRPGVRGWQKLRTRVTVEAVIGGVVGPLDWPESLILGLFDETGRLHVAGRTRPLAGPAKGDLGAVLTAPADGHHPWPSTLPPSRFGQLSGGRIDYTPVAPLLVVEVEADVAFEHGRWRHLTTYLRRRPEVRLDELKYELAD